MAILTAGTDLYFIDPYDNSVNKAGCVTNISGLSAPKEQLEVTCLADRSRRYMSGLASPGQATFSINADPSDPSHIRLHELYKEGEEIAWAIGWSDGTTDPTVGSAGGFVLPVDRSFLDFMGSVTDFPFDFSSNAVVTSSITLQVSGDIVWTPASP